MYEISHWLLIAYAIIASITMMHMATEIRHLKKNRK